MEEGIPKTLIIPSVPNCRHPLCMARRKVRIGKVKAPGRDDRRENDAQIEF